MKTIILAPHCDDEVLAAASLAAEDPTNFQVVVMVSHGGGSELLPHVQGNTLASWREFETSYFCKKLGMPEPIFLRAAWPNEWSDYNREIVKNFLVAYKNEYSRIITSHPEDRHLDHKEAGQIVLSLLLNKEILFFVNSIVQAAILPEPDYVNRLSQGQWEKKREWVSYYESQAHFLPTHFEHPWFRHERFWTHI